MNARFGAILAGLLFTACSQSSASQSAAQAATDAASQPASAGSLEGIKYRVPLYSSNVTAPAAISLPGTYQFQTADDFQTVLAWYKSHVPSDIGGTWVSSDPSGTPENQDWSFANAKVAGGAFYVDIEHVRKGVPVYATGSKTIVEVGDN